MTEEEKAKKYKDDGFEYEFYKNLEENWKKAEEKDKWLVENYNTVNKDLSERFTWMVGIGIALLPFIFEFMTPTEGLPTWILILALGSSFISILSGGIDFLVTQHFWKTHAQNNKCAVEIWYEGMKEIKKEYPNNEEYIHDKTHSRINNLQLEDNPIATEFWTKAQIITGFSSVLLFISYLVIYIIF